MEPFEDWMLNELEIEEKEPQHDIFKKPLPQLTNEQLDELDFFRIVIRHCLTNHAQTDIFNCRMLASIKEKYQKPREKHGNSSIITAWE